MVVMLLLPKFLEQSPLHSTPLIAFPLCIFVSLSSELCCLLRQCFQKTNRPAFVYAVVRGLAAVCLQQAIGNGVNSGERLRVVRVSLGRHLTPFWSVEIVQVLSLFPVLVEINSTLYS